MRPLSTSGVSVGQGYNRGLIAQLIAKLQKVPAEQAGEAETVAEMAKAPIEQATKAQPNKTLVKISADGLK